MQEERDRRALYAALKEKFEMLHPAHADVQLVMVNDSYQTLRHSIKQFGDLYFITDANAQAFVEGDALVSAEIEGGLVKPRLEALKNGAAASVESGFYTALWTFNPASVARMMTFTAPLGAALSHIFSREQVVEYGDRLREYVEELPVSQVQHFVMTDNTEKLADFLTQSDRKHYYIGSLIGRALGGSSKEEHEESLHRKLQISLHG